jgi:phosphohistidine phosphatase SixA
LALGCTVLAFPVEAAPETSSVSVVYVVRHAERADDGGMVASKDPDLSAEGHARARRLATMLRDAGITRIFTTEYRRSRQTAEPLVSSTGPEVETLPAKDIVALIERIAAHAEPLLVVGHSNTVPDILQALGVGTPIRMADDEYDNLFVVVRSDASPPLVVRLRY